MKEFLFSQRIANKVRMIRIQFTGSFLIVEGDTDARLYKSFVDGDRCQIVPANGKDNTIEALSILEKDRFPGVLAIVDADFDLLEGKSSPSQNLLLTDTHDLETMIIQSPALEKVLGEFASETKIADFVQNARKDVRTALIENGIHIGYLRWVSLREGLPLSFEDLEFSKFVSRETLTVDIQKLVNAVKEKSYKAELDRARKLAIMNCNPQASMAQLKNDTHDHWHICCGHDLVSVLSIGLCKAIGSCNANDVKPDVLERSLRLAFERPHFQKTHLYSSIQNWEKTNQPFVVLSVE